MKTATVVYYCVLILVAFVLGVRTTYFRFSDPSLTETQLLLKSIGLLKEN